MTREETPARCLCAAIRARGQRGSPRGREGSGGRRPRPEPGPGHAPPEIVYMYTYTCILYTSNICFVWPGRGQGPRAGTRGEREDTALLAVAAVVRPHGARGEEHDEGEEEEAPAEEFDVRPRQHGNGVAADSLLRRHEGLEAKRHREQLALREVVLRLDCSI